MAPKTDESKSPFTGRDYELIAAAFQSTTEPIKIDYKTFALKAHLANANSAKASWHALKRKIDKVGTEAAAKRKTPSSSSSSPPSDDNANDDDVDATTNDEPASKKLKMMKGGDEGGSNGSGDEVAVKGRDEGREVVNAPARKRGGRKAKKTQVADGVEETGEVVEPKKKGGRQTGGGGGGAKKGGRKAKAKVEMPEPEVEDEVAGDAEEVVESGDDAEETAAEAAEDEVKIKPEPTDD